MSPAGTAAAAGSALVTVIPVPGHVARLGLFFVDRESSPGIWDVAGKVLITRRLGVTPTRNQTLNPKRVNAIYEFSTKSVAIRVYFPNVPPGTKLRLRGNPGVLSNTFTAEATERFSFGRPQALGSHCQDTKVTLLQRSIERWDDSKGRWDWLPGDPGRTCDGIEAGLYRIRTKAGGLDRYMTAG